MTLRGLPEVLAGISEVLTEPLSIDGLSSDQDFETELVLPEGTRLADGASPTVTVTAGIVPSVSSRTFVVGVLCRAPATMPACPRSTSCRSRSSGPARRSRASTPAT